jgi:hypothetical protein
MKSRSTNDKTSGSRAVASDVGQSSMQGPATYEIKDGRAASIMQRKLRNLANGLASANIIATKTNSNSPISVADPGSFSVDNHDSD